MDKKTTGVMDALKGREGFASKKGVDLMGIVKKLSDKRAAMNDGAGGPGYSAGLPSQAKVPGMPTLPSQANSKASPMRKGKPFTS